MYITSVTTRSQILNFTKPPTGSLEKLDSLLLIASTFIPPLRKIKLSDTDKFLWMIIHTTDISKQTMSILCCRRGDPNTVNRSVSLSPKIVGHVTTPHPQSSRQNIEAIYNEGRELLNTRQEERDKPSLRNEIKEECEISKRFYKVFNYCYWIIS